MPDDTGSPAPAGAPAPARTPLRAVARRGAAFGLGAAALALVGCTAGNAATPAQPIKIVSAYVMQTTGFKTVDAYFVLANSGPADRLISVSSSAGGKVLMLGPAAPGVSVARARTALTIRGHAVTKLDPTGMYLEILNSGPLRVGDDVTLTLTFAHDGQLKIPAQVNNPQTGNSGYFGS